MKKIVTGLSIALIVIGILGYSITKSGISDYKQAHGIILYGNKEDIKKDLQNISDQDFSVILEANYKLIGKTMIIKESDASNMAIKGLLNEVKSDDKVAPIKDFSLKDGIPAYWGKEKKSSISIDSKDMNVVYGGNIIIGMGRTLVDYFVVVSDDIYKTMSSDEYTLKAVQFKNNPKNLMIEFKNTVSQLTLFN